ncbi:DUF1878 family protein [Pseudalkalibacillus sp. SCS-8]|uniref:DUF1878 family protein n=1 Tax=Pseudalkalibacillus nanhaiensis TaxID=3115291 RepID=UPI0032DB38E7
MNSVESSKRIDRLSFYQEILLDTINPIRFPWYRIIIEKGMERAEVEEVYALFEQLEERKENIREAGMLDMTPLLFHYVGMLNSDLDPFMTAKALHDQGIHKSLTAELIELMKEKEGAFK